MFFGLEYKRRGNARGSAASCRNNRFRRIYNEIHVQGHRRRRNFLQDQQGKARTQFQARHKAPVLAPGAQGKEQRKAQLHRALA